MDNRLLSRNVTIDGRRTSIRLEEEMWAAFDEICAREGLTAHALCSLIEARRQGTNRTSAVRAFIVAYFRIAAGSKAARRTAGAKKVLDMARNHRGPWTEFPFPSTVLKVFDEPFVSRVRGFDTGPSFD